MRGPPGDPEEGATIAAAKSARIVDAREELCRDFAFPVLQWQAKYEGVYLLGTSIARPLISKVCLQVGPRSRGRGLRPRRDRQGERPVPLSTRGRGARAGDQDHRPLADRRSSATRFPAAREMIAYCDRKNIPVKASVTKPYSSDENCLHISYEAGKLEDLKVNGVELVDFGMTVSPQEAPDKVENGRNRLRVGRAGRRQRQESSVRSGDRARAEQDRRPQRRRPHRHGREPLRRHEEPRRVRSPRHDDPLRRPSRASSN